MLQISNNEIEKKFGLKAGFVQFLIKKHNIETLKQLRKLLKKY